MEPSWDTNLEIGVRFWRWELPSRPRRQKTSRPGEKSSIVCKPKRPTPMPSIAIPNRTERAHGMSRTAAPVRERFLLHGGGYTFHGAMSYRFAATPAHHTAAPVFAPDYRLTPEHPHPAQADDAMTAWSFITGKESADRIVVIGDSAGGHLMLSLLLSLKDAVATAARPRHRIVPMDRYRRPGRQLAWQ